MPQSAHLEFDTARERVAQRVHKLRSSPVRDLFSAATRSDMISLSGGMPDVSLIPYEAIRQATDAVVNNDGLRAIALQYGSTDGALGMKKVVCSLMRDIGVRCAPEQVFLTSGAQQALSLIAKTFLDPGDIVITEGPTYLTALSAFNGYEPEIVTIAFDDEGMRTDLLEEALERIGKSNPRLKFIYVVPNFQNPGGVTMSAERRRRLIELANEYNVMLIEDDPY